MKFVLAYTLRASGTAAENVAGGEAAQKLLESWTPSPQATIHQWVQRCDGGGGFSIIETDSAADLYKDLVTWNPWLEFQVYPVLDLLETVPLTSEALSIAKSAL